MTEYQWFSFGGHVRNWVRLEGDIPHVEFKMDGGGIPLLAFLFSGYVGDRILIMDGVIAN